MTNQRPFESGTPLTTPYAYADLAGGAAPSRDRLGPGQRAALYLTVGALTFLFLCVGGVTVLGALGGGPTPGTPAAQQQAAQTTRNADPANGSPSSPEATVTVPPTPTDPVPTSAAPPPVEKRRVVQTRSIAFTERTVRDASLARGVRKVRVRGVAGVRTLTYEVTVTGGEETGRTLVGDVVTRQPVTQVVAVGTKEASRCDPNYGGCVPIASDVDCAGGSGNGPAYVSGPVKVIGADIYDLDRDGDGYGCDG